MKTGALKVIIATINPYSGQRLSIQIVFHTEEQAKERHAHFWAYII